MELLITLVVGAMLGYGVAKAHPVVSAGPMIGVAAGVVGAWLGARMLGSTFASLLADHTFAGEIAGAAVGAMVLAAATGLGVTLLGRRQSRRQT